MAKSYVKSLNSNLRVILPPGPSPFQELSFQMNVSITKLNTRLWSLSKGYVSEFIWLVLEPRWMAFKIDSILAAAWNHFEEGQ